MFNATLFCQCLNDWLSLNYGHMSVTFVKSEEKKHTFVCENKEDENSFEFTLEQLGVLFDENTNTNRGIVVLECGELSVAVQPVPAAVGAIIYAA